MNNLNINLEKYKTNKKAATYYWQELAIETIKSLDNPVKSQVFRWAKLKETKLKAAIDYMKHRKIRNFMYLAKLMSL